MVEDDPAIAQMYTYALRRAGYEVVIADTSDAAVRMATEAGPDLVLMDIGLPGRSGLEVLREFRTKPGTAELPVVMLTNYGDPNFVAESEGLGALDYLIKSSTSPTMLAERVKGWCTSLGKRSA